MTQPTDPVDPTEPTADPTDPSTAEFESSLHAADAPELSAADDAFLATLLADLPPLTMPADVAARIDAALAAEPAFEAADPADEAGVEPFTAAATVVPLAQPKRSGTPRLLQVAAAVVLVAAGGAFAVKTLGQNQTQLSTAAGSEDASGALASSGLPPRVTNSGTDYTAANIDGAVLQSLAGSRGASDAPALPTTDTKSSVPNPTTYQLASDSAVLAQCINAVQGNPVQPQPAVAIDLGTFERKPAVVIVVQSTKANVFSTYVVSPDCGTTDEPQILYFANVTRP